MPRPLLLPILTLSLLGMCSLAVAEPLQIADHTPATLVEVESLTDLPYFDPALFGLSWSELQASEGVPEFASGETAQTLGTALVTVYGQPAMVRYHFADTAGLTSIELAFLNPTEATREALTAGLAPILPDLAFPETVVAPARWSQQWRTESALITLGLREWSGEKKSYLYLSYWRPVSPVARLESETSQLR